MSVHMCELQGSALHTQIACTPPHKDIFIVTAPDLAQPRVMRESLNGGVAQIRLPDRVLD